MPPGDSVNWISALLFTPGSQVSQGEFLKVLHASTENRMEILEGLAVYTDTRLLAPDHAGTMAQIAHMVQVYSSGMNLRQFGYANGALYALLLNELDIEWKIGLRWSDNLGAMLQQAMGLSQLSPTHQLDLTRFGYD